MGAPLNKDDYGFSERSLILEKCPTDGGYKKNCVGGMEALCTWANGMNKKGLMFLSLSDRTVHDATFCC